jgi:hypothetical protein
MRYLLYGIGLLVAASLAVAMIGFALPSTRQGTLERVLPAPPALTLETLLDVESQPAWRRGIVSVERTAEGWIEKTDEGETISFRVTQQRPDRVEMAFESSRGYHGSWQGVLTEQDGGTLLRVTETATTPSPVGRILSRLFFDPEAYARAYMDALEAEMARRGAAS